MGDVFPAAAFHAENPRLAADGSVVLSSEEHQCVVGLIQYERVIFTRGRYRTVRENFVPLMSFQIECPELAGDAVVVIFAAVHEDTVPRRVVGDGAVLSRSGGVLPNAGSRVELLPSVGSRVSRVRRMVGLVSGGNDRFPVFDIWVSVAPGELRQYQDRQNDKSEHEIRCLRSADA